MWSQVVMIVISGVAVFLDTWRQMTDLGVDLSWVNMS